MLVGTGQLGRNYISILQDLQQLQQQKVMEFLSFITKVIFDVITAKTPLNTWLNRAMTLNKPGYSAGKKLFLLIRDE